MERQRRRPADKDPFTTLAKGGVRDRLKDAGSKELTTLAKKLGNDRVQVLLQEATGKRDALLAFIRSRLTTIQGAQGAELRSMQKDRVWFDEVARRKRGFGLPDPTRWRGPALLYKRAADALCAGDLSRGADLLGKAVEAERAAFESVPVQVDLDTSKPAAAPDESAFVSAGEACPATRAPEVFAAADAVIRVADRSREQYVPPSARQHRGWWDAPEEDAERDKKEKKEKKDGKGEAKAEEREPEKKETDEEKAHEKETKRRGR